MQLRTDWRIATGNVRARGVFWGLSCSSLLCCLLQPRLDLSSEESQQGGQPLGMCRQHVRLCRQGLHEIETAKIMAVAAAL